MLNDGNLPVLYGSVLMNTTSELKLKFRFEYAGFRFNKTETYI